MTIWCQDRATRRLILLGYLPWLAGLSLAWEIVQLPLYTIWSDAPAYRVFAVAHCTVGDLLVGLAALGTALIVLRAGPLANWRWVRITAITTLAGVGYTFFSEWMNTSVRQSWEYSQLMPTLEVAGFAIGLSPLAQWLVLPPLALWLAGRRRHARTA